MRRTLALALTATLVLAGCGSDSDNDLADVEVGGSENPSVTVAEGFEVDATETRVVADGSGEEVEDGDVIKVNYVAVNGRTGEQFDNSFSAERPMTFTMSEGTVLPGFIKGLMGQKIGSRVLVAIPPADGFDQAQDTLGVEADDTLVFLFDIIAKVPTEASGEAEELPDTVPSIVEEDGQPSGFEAGPDVPEDPTESASYVAIKGDGPEVTADQELSVQYVGVVYPDGEVFDSSWSRGTPSSFTLDGVIQCWQDQLPGQTIGSRVVLVCPSDTAYGAQEGHELQDDTLLFAVDLLDAS